MSVFKQKGFTLVELSLVIIIIGLIAAGIFAGQSLVKQSKLKSIVTQMDVIRTASNSFQLEYQALPGDIPMAYSYWGNACDATPANCNGNGNGIVDNGSASDSELYRFWQHLNFAQLYPGNYTGFAAAGLNCTLNINTPSGPLSGSGYWISPIMPSSSWVTGYSVSVGKCAGTSVANTALFAPTDSYNLDVKLDDGMPRTGMVMSNAGISASGACAGAAINGTYTVTNTGIACYTFFRIK